MFVTKFLGVDLDFQLNWSKHISVITNKIANNVSLMYMMRHCHELPGEANRTSKRKRGDMRNKEYMEAIKEQTQNV